MSRKRKSESCSCTGPGHAHKDWEGMSYGIRYCTHEGCRCSFYFTPQAWLDKCAQATIIYVD